MIGKIISHYEILSRIGSGGMGVVYKARDTSLNRMVAVKFLPAHLTHDETLKNRFLREARVASCLDHPNICTMHEIGEDKEGQLFLVMAYYEGETLAARIRRRLMSFTETIDIQRQVLEGLGALHQLGVIHRDIKPGNVIVTTQNEVKIVDFGLAKVRDPSELLTRTGGVLGTFAYMSPEQLHGFDVDIRTDLWGAGVILYEMLTGRHPFSSQNAGALFHAITHDEPISPLFSRSDLPLGVESITRKALAKDRHLRYQSAHEFLRDLHSLSVPFIKDTTVGGGTALRVLSHHSILVLPFVNLGSGGEDEYFSDGLTDQIITDLSSIRSLRVICRTSAMRLKGTSKSLREVTSELRVQHVLEGTVRREGNSLRVTAELIDPATDSLLWADKYRGSPDDVFEIQEQVSRKIAAALKLKLSPEEEQILGQRPIQDFQAYEYYLKAKHEILSYSKDSLERALEYLQSGLRILGRNILLTSAIGQVHWQFVNAGISTDPSHLEKVRQCAHDILAEDPGSPHAYRLLGLLEITEGNTQQGVLLLKRTLADHPNDPDTLVWLIAVFGFSGNPYVAFPMVKRLLHIDPLTPSYQCLPGLLALMAGEFGHALKPFEKSLQMDPINPMVRFCYAHVLALNRRLEESLRVIDVLHRELPNNFFAKLGRFYTQALAGDKIGALESATADLLSTAGADPHYAWNVAQCYALLNEKTKGLDWLERAMSLGFINYPLLSRLDPFVESLRAEARFETLIQQARDRWEAFET
jgi:eukaryotic-like serine/threonine-protein kinase